LESHKLNRLADLFRKWEGNHPDNIIALPPSGSYREYYRLTYHNHSAIGVYNEDKKENEAFIEFTRHFSALKLPVPELYNYDPESNTYLLEDLGNLTLLEYLNSVRKNNAFPVEAMNIYKRVLNDLPGFQVRGAKELNYQVCYPRHAFDKQSMMWDLNYFKYYFLKLAKIPFNEQKLEDDFQSLSDFLLKANCEYFLYRDFQSRNIMLHNDNLYFIDYQGGRKGALQYDVASLLYEAKTNLPEAAREELLKHYLSLLHQVIDYDEVEFMRYYHGYVLIRMMQAMGAYGFRGLYERKPLFLQSIPDSIKNITGLVKTKKLNIELPELFRTIESLEYSETLKEICQSVSTLTVTIRSFSYRRGMPQDATGNGGGYVFDCRAIHNPGRYEEFKQLNGKDIQVDQFFKEQSEMEQFLLEVYAIIDRSVETYKSRHYKNLMVCFGCTGGQHRSVYAAESLAKHIQEKFTGVLIDLNHLESGNW
jgi:aminoglycoside/choline kinase family phosphotransferase